MTHAVVYVITQHGVQYKSVVDSLFLRIVYMYGHVHIWWQLSVLFAGLVMGSGNNNGLLMMFL